MTDFSTTQGRPVRIFKTVAEAKAALAVDAFGTRVMRGAKVVFVSTLEGMGSFPVEEWNRAGTQAQKPDGGGK